MLDRETCREHILSEDYRDFIGNHVRTPFFNSLMNVHRCEQEAGFFLTNASIFQRRFPTRSLCRNIHMLRFRTAIRLLICRHSTKPESSLFKIYPTLQLKGRNIFDRIS